MTPAGRDGPHGLPSYRDLPAVEGAPPGSSWGLWPDPTLGALSLLSADIVLAARESMRTGQVFPFDLDQSFIDPPLFGRAALRVEAQQYPTGALDDVVGNWNTQASTQWDGFCHQVHPTHGYYGGASRAEHGMHRWAAHGIAGRGVLLDLPRWRQMSGQPAIDHDTREVIAPEDLVACLETQGSDLRTGDILLVRTGWLSWYRSADPEKRCAMAAPGAFGGPGLSAHESMAALLWDWHVSAVAADNPTLEAWPRGPDAFLHHRLLNLLGIPIGELWNLDALAKFCASSGHWDVFITSAPLAIVGAVGSPANAVAIG